MKTILFAAAVLAVLPAAAMAQSSHTMSDHSTMAGAKHGEEAAVAGIGTVNGVDAGARKVNVTHEPIAAIGWPAMTMDFAVAEGVDLAALEAGAPVSFTLTRGADGIYMIETIQAQ
ncbi:cation efflux system protein [Caenispirillum salinarum AK4]|uniref:Cation efflux system protein n=1 Tax=Caenispirillum salinarum AK4 TaxID=1238182 RepID=K9GUI1_9PROT|nr:copper-binding protein [Caenispirillum salinarum]EKV28857.1 cation efflux system protein [Caenispirillum salinarum AK4]